jgi:tRNA G18 (ribose-2'-O)-methylase SpoU
MITTIHHITTLDLPELETYRTLRRPMEHLQQGIFVAEGEKVVLRLLESELTVRSLLVSRDRFAGIEQRIRNNRNPIKVFVGEKKLLDTIVGHDLHQAILAIGSVPQPISSQQIAARMTGGITGEAGRRYFVLVDGITNAENMGVIIRNCVCFGAGALLVLPTSCDPYLRRSVRNSMGNIFQFPIAYIHETIREIQSLKKAGVTFIAAHPHATSSGIDTATFPDNCCIVFGAEGHGISPDVLSLCDAYVTIPMKEGVDSLNVASASAVILFHIQQHGTLHRKSPATEGAGRSPL